VIGDAGAGDPAEVPADVEALWTVELRQRPHALPREPMNLQGLAVTELRELTDVPEGRDHQVAGGIGEPVQERECLPAAMDDEAGLVLALGGPAKDAPFLLVGLLDVFEAPGRPQRFRHGAEVRTSSLRETALLMPFRAALALVAALLVAGVSNAAGQQPAPTCLEARATIVGTPGNDSLVGTSGQDVIDALQGNDTVDGGLGDDLICAGDGDDVVLGNNGADGLVGGLGNDRLDGGAGELNIAVYFEAPAAVAVDLAAGTVTGASGSDSLVNINAVVGSRRADTLKGGTGDDLLVGLGGNDVLAGRGGNDLLSGSGGDDRLTGGGGVDIADYSSLRRRVRVNLTTGLAFGEGRDRLREVEGVVGGVGGDELIGDRQRNLLFGANGNDTIEGRAGRDDLNGGRGRDRLNGGAGRDRCRAGEIMERCP
jgi:Ca2+-binding RTX toxin-like protein